jgi:eukaryotic-like serine/threonine-protein kinase
VFPETPPAARRMAPVNPHAPDLKSIFSEALDHPTGSERSAYLDRACGADPMLRFEVDSLLKAHDDAGDFLGSSAEIAGEGRPSIEAPRFAPDLAVADTLDRAAGPEAEPSISALRPLAEAPGTTIGPYKLLQQIGEGGMGVVFMAEQEKPIRRKVALKVIKPGMDTAQVIARFEAERQALAIMDHPQIARVLDVGATETGRPFFVMELVRGVPITEYCDRNLLSPKERLELFIPVCEAIQHAHQKGIIHRDIKPSNVLVTLADGKPTPKVIDFGVAKAIDQRLTERTLFTEFGAVIGTLEYMSPEQAELGALDIDTRSDIYALGVLLYELLTGSTPLDRTVLRTAAYSEALRRIRDEEPPRPSTRLSESRDSLPSISAQRKTDPARLTRLVRGDLDWIVMKCLEKDRTRRYQTASGFARDIQRHLDRDPVEACPPSASYKLKKFARKHQAALGIAGAFVLLLVAATTLSVALAVWAFQAERSAREQQLRAQDREQMAIDAVRQYGDTVRQTPELKNNPALNELRATLLRGPQSFFRTLRAKIQSAPETMPGALARLATANFDLGSITDELGDKQDALRAFEESLAIRERLAREHPQVREYASDLAASLNYIGRLQVEAGHLTEALVSHKRSLAIRQRLATENPTVASLERDHAWSENNVGTVYEGMGRHVEALESYERARAIFERLARENPAVTRLQIDLAWSHGHIAHLEQEMGRLEQALESRRAAHEISVRLAKEKPSVIPFEHEVIISFISIGNVQNAMGHTDQAADSYEQARRIVEQQEREHPESPELASDMGMVLHNLARIDLENRHYDQAEEKLRQAVERQRKAIATRPFHAAYRHLLANHLRHLIRASESLGHKDTAGAARRELAALGARAF